MELKSSTLAWVTFLLIAFLYPDLSSSQDLKKIDSLKAVILASENDSSQFNALLTLYGFQVNTPDAAFATLNEALALSVKRNDKNKEGKVLSRLAYVYNQTGNSVMATRKLLEALAIYEQLKDSITIAAINNNIGLVYKDRGENEEALRRFEMAVKVWMNVNFKSGMERALNNMAHIYLLQNKNDLALKNFLHAQALCNANNDKQFSSAILNGMGKVCYNLKQYEKALDFQQRAIVIAKEFNQRATQSEILVEQSKIFNAISQPLKGLGLALEALGIARAANYKVGMMNSFAEIAHAYHLLKNYAAAYAYQARYMRLRDSIRDAENVSHIQHLNYGHELDKKEVEIDLLKEQHHTELFKRNAFIVTGVLLFMIISLMLSYQRIRSKRKLEAQDHELKIKQQQLDFLKLGLLEKSELLEKVTQELNHLTVDKAVDDVPIENYNRILQSHILTQEDWENFKKAFEDVYPNFFATLRYKYPEITNAELRLAALIKLNLSLKESAKMLGVSPESVKQSRYRLKKKLNIKEVCSLEDFVKEVTGNYSRTAAGKILPNPE